MLCTEAIFTAPAKHSTICGMATLIEFDAERVGKREAILAELRQLPSYKRACAAVGINISTLRRWRIDDSAFNDECEAARRAGFEALEDEAVERGLFKGSDRLLMFMLAGYRPSIFGDSQRASQAREETQEPTRLIINDA